MSAFRWRRKYVPGILGWFSGLAKTLNASTACPISDTPGAFHLPPETTIDASHDDFEYESPFAQLLGLRHHPTVDGVGLASMTIQDKHRQRAGVVQGGIIAALADFAFHLAVQTHLRPGQTAVTVELKVNFLSPAKDGELKAAARIVSAGRRIIVCDVDVTGEDDKLVAKCLGTYIVGGQAA